MNCTRLLQVMPSPITSVDVAMRLCLATSPPIHSFLRNYDNRPALRPCLSSRTCSTVPPPPGGAPLATPTSASPLHTGPHAPRQKKVVFADSQGLSLTVVHVFNQFDQDPLADLQFHLLDLHPGPDEQGPGLVLDFTQPAADYLDFRNRLKTYQVCLENCSLQEYSLSGTIKVRNISFHKSVHVRTTFDSWSSFQDLPCSFLNNIYGCPDTDTFSFCLELPQALGDDGVEFCIRYQTQDQTFWDNNDGHNYRLVPVRPNCISRTSAVTTPLEIHRGGGGGRREEGKDKDMEFDRFGSPRTSTGIFPEWQSWGRIENSTPYW